MPSFLKRRYGSIFSTGTPFLKFGTKLIHSISFCTAIVELHQGVDFYSIHKPKPFPQSGAGVFLESAVSGGFMKASQHL